MLLLLCALCMNAATKDVKIPLWSGTLEVTDGWAGAQSIASDLLQQAVTGDEIAVTVSVVSQTADYPQISLRKTAGWAQFDPPVGLNLDKAASVPYEARIALTEDVVNEIKANGFVVTGCGFTATSIDLIHKQELAEGEKGEPVHNIWTGEVVFDDPGWSDYQTLEAALFADAQAGWKMRCTYKDCLTGAQIMLNNGSWGAMPGAEQGVQLSPAASYADFTVNADMLAELQANGCIIKGIGYTLTKVDLIDPSQIPSMACTLTSGTVKCWEAGENPQIGVTLNSLEGSETKTTVSYRLFTDAGEFVSEGSEEVTVPAGGEQTVTFPLTLKPGFYHAAVEANYVPVRDFNIGYDPTAIVSAPDMQPDFEDFWAKAKAELAAVPIDAKLTLQEDLSTGARNIYFVEMQSVGNGDGKPVTIRGYYAVPKAEGTYPVVITQNGYDSRGESQIYIPDTNGNPEWIELNISNRGQLVNNRPPYKEENAFYGEDYKPDEWFAYNFGDKDTYYYRGAYMDVVRSIDFVCSQDKVQKENIFMTGGSQGGAFAIAGAALGDGRLNAIAPSIQFMGDFPDYFKVGSWPASTARAMQEKLSMSDEEMYKFLSYFDTKNLATLVTCPVTTAMGLQDPVCPPHTNFAPYNNFKSEEKHYVVNPECQHETPADWYDTYMDFFTQHLKTVEQPVEGETVLLEEHTFPKWETLTVTNEKLADIKEGDQIIVTVTATDKTVSQYPQFSIIKANNEGDFEPKVSVALANVTEFPHAETITVTAEMAEYMAANGFAIKGTGFTFSSVILKQEKAETPVEPTIVDINLYTGEQVCTDDWQGYQIIDASKCQLIAAGDEIVVTVSALSPTSSSPQLLLNNKSWENLVDAEAINLAGVTVPYEAVINVTEAMATEIKANGFIVKGVGFTFTSVVLKHKVYPSGVEKGDAATTVWTGNEVISWVTGSNNSFLVAASSLPSGMKAGDKVRVYITGLGVESATGRLLANWTALEGFTNISPLKGNYYEYTLTDANVTALKESGLRISGNKYTATRVDIIDPAKEYLIISQIDDADIKAWEKDETPNLTMTMTNVETEELTVPYTITIYRDMVDEDTNTHSIYKTYSKDVTLAAGATVTETIDMDGLTEPGFYQMIASVNGNDVCTYNIGYDPTGIVSPSTAIADKFWPYWKEAMDELETIPMDATLIEQPSLSNDYRTAYIVEMKSVADAEGEEPIVIKGYYFEPKEEGTYPTLIQYQGTDNGKSTLTEPTNDESRKDWCEFILSTRGQRLCRNQNYCWTDAGGNDFYSYGWGDMRKHYYRNAYLDCVRAVDFVKSREKVDEKAIFAAGGSQGGCFTYVAAGLTQAFRAIAPSITGHADFVDGMRIVNWPRQKFLDAQAALGWSDKERDECNSYYDTMNFAERVNCPVITNFSLQDTTDPAHTNIAPYNLLQNVEKEDNRYIVNPFLGHATPGDWTQTYMDFFEQYVGTEIPSGINEVTAEEQATADGPAYNLAGMRVSKDYKGIVIVNGKKFVRR